MIGLAHPACRFLRCPLSLSAWFGRSSSVCGRSVYPSRVISFLALRHLGVLHGKFRSIAARFRPRQWGWRLGFPLPLGLREHLPVGGGKARGRDVAGYSSFLLACACLPGLAWRLSRAGLAWPGSVRSACPRMAEAGGADGGYSFLHSFRAQEPDPPPPLQVRPGPEGGAARHAGTRTRWVAGG